MNDTTISETQTIIGTIQNSKDPSQCIDIRYLPYDNAFVTSGIRTQFNEMEILIPAHLAVIDFQLMGTIVSAILENLSQAHDREGTFAYPPRFVVLNKTYTFTRQGAYMKLSVLE